MHNVDNDVEDVAQQWYFTERKLSRYLMKLKQGHRALPASLDAQRALFKTMLDDDPQLQDILAELQTLKTDHVKTRAALRPRRQEDKRRRLTEVISIDEGSGGSSRAAQDGSGNASAEVSTTTAMDDSLDFKALIDEEQTTLLSPLPIFASGDTDGSQKSGHPLSEAAFEAALQLYTVGQVDETFVSAP